MAEVLVFLPCILLICLVIHVRILGSNTVPDLNLKKIKIRIKKEQGLTPDGDIE